MFSSVELDPDGHIEQLIEPSELTDPASQEVQSSPLQNIPAVQTQCSAPATEVDPFGQIEHVDKFPAL